MKATSRMSAPKDADMIVMAEAAPGNEPQIAVVPGSTWNFASAQPSEQAATTTETTPARKIGQSRDSSARMESGIDRAIMQPMTPCAKSPIVCGMATGQSRAASRIAAPIGPISSAAGIWVNSRIATNRTDRASSAAQRLA